MPSPFLCRAFCGSIVAIALVGEQYLARQSGAAQAQAAVGLSANPIKKSGYALDGTSCGAPPMAFAKLPIGMRPGYCAGLVASNEDGLIFPRSVVQVPDKNLFVVADMGNFDSPGVGRLLLLDPQAPAGKRLKVLMTKLDLPHGLAVGIDRRLYASTADRIFRFDPLAKLPATTVEVILQNLPARRVTLSDGTIIPKASHPLKQFVFDKTGRIYVNIGAPSDTCKESAPKRCSAGEGAAPLAPIWAFTPPASGTFPALKSLYYHGGKFPTSTQKAFRPSAWLRLISTSIALPSPPTRSARNSKRRCLQPPSTS
jgi:glucose/arabinose dehydrogenase